jgi:hypothetical protein
MPKILAGLGGFFDRRVRYQLYRVGVDANLHKFLSLVWWVEIHLPWGLPSKSHNLSFSGFAYHGLKNSMYISATCLCLPIQIAVFFQLQSVIWWSC